MMTQLANNGIIQHGKHGHSHMAEPGMMLFPALMIKRGFEARAGIRVGQFAGNRQR